MQMQRGLFVCSPLRGPGIRQCIFLQQTFFFHSGLASLAPFALG